MYPTLGGGGSSYPAPPPLQTTMMAPTSSTAGMGGGGAQRPTTPTHGALCSVRVEIASAYRSDPPVPLTSIESIPDTSNFQFDFEYERAVVRRAAEEASGAAPADKDELELLAGAAPEAPELFTAAVETYKQMGFPAEAACLGVGVHGFGPEKQSEVVEFCNSYARLKEMGFPPQTIAGALFMNKNDAQAATEQLMMSM